jgi:DNA (cytosine-5)-methyltransferase 1
MRPRLLDLFCGCGGCSVGYTRAGFDVEGVDLVAMYHSYPYRFHRHNALTFPLTGFDAVHASPPCKVHTVLGSGGMPQAEGLFPKHIDLLGPIRDRLVASGLPYVIENVPGAPMLEPVTYCGSSFALMVRRHRLFETNWPVSAPPCDHASQPVVHGVYGYGGGDRGRQARKGGGGIKVARQEAADALGIDWTTDQKVLSQAIPPAYTEHIGAQLLTYLKAAA